MTYTDTINWMFTQLPMYQNQGESAYKKDLSNTVLLANYLKNPETNFNTTIRIEIPENKNNND